ncbi:O-antigen ligase family protein [Hydrogenophaga sp. PAMC20947]|uniref:O-antigen ligase family protein n=1 Tax=Hydrogenophaga sp. PAMC20947 TaxID=2565558 RepID=UPI00109E04CA|nr:O-antigen ligase family protein [Hydrogenophaga sp. PAMC20947]QCB46397.1 O-antigen ligase family protein [Hydrogenophaga sp. PAMC20947]
MNIRYLRDAHRMGVRCCDLILLWSRPVVREQVDSAALGTAPRWIWALFLALVAFAPGSTKVAGSIWIFTVSFAVWCLFFVPKASALRTDEAALLSLSKLWLRFCIVAMAFKAVGMTYWGDPWWTRHFDFRILLAAAAMPTLLARFRISAEQKSQLISALVIASGVALIVAYRLAYHDVETPSNRINWSGGLVMLTCAILPMLKDDLLAGRQKWAVGVGAVAYVLAVLLIGARGAYLALPWVFFGGVVLLGGSMWRSIGATRSRRYAALVLVGMLAIVPIFLPKVLEVPVERVTQGVSELQAMVSREAVDSSAIDTSVGTRLYMWQRSKNMIAESPWIGFGREQRIAFIQTWGAEANAHIVLDQTHLHSEYVNGMIDHGIFGLLSTLSYMVGAVVLAWKLRRLFPLAAFSVGGIAYTHIVMSFTDTNSQTNNYSVMLTVSLLIVFLLSLSDPARRMESQNERLVPSAK